MKTNTIPFHVHLLRQVLSLQMLYAPMACPLSVLGESVSFNFSIADGDAPRIERTAASSGYTRKLTKGGKLRGTFACPAGTYFASVTLAHQGSPAIIRCTVDGCDIDFSTAAVRSAALEVATWDTLHAIVCLEPIQLSTQTVHTLEATVVDCDERFGIEVEQFVLKPQKPTLPRLPLILEAERPGHSVYRSSASGGCSRPMKMGDEIVLPFCTEGGRAEMLVRYSQDADLPSLVEVAVGEHKFRFRASNTRTGELGGGWNNFTSSPCFPIELPWGRGEVRIRLLDATAWGWECDAVEFRIAPQKVETSVFQPN